jgi:glycine cleavage system pyridoxal-binding protein P
MSESELLHHMKVTASKNKVLTSLIGQGYHGTVTPPAIQRNILENPAWYTAYTPYQPEISQGRLEALLNFQTMVSDLTGLEISNASLLDEATACAEAMTMAQRVAKTKVNGFFVDESCHPQNIAVMKTRAAPLGIEITVGNPDDLDPAAVFGGIFQFPGTHGHLRDFTPEIAKLHETKAIGIIAADPMSLTLFKEPGAMGADIAVGSTACSLYGDQAELRTFNAGAYCWCLDRQSWQPCIPLVIANTRAAHSPRKSDVECVYGAGAACCDGWLLRCFPRPRRAACDCAAYPPQNSALGRGA